MKPNKTAVTIAASALGGAALATLVITVFFGGTRLTRSEYDKLSRVNAVSEVLSVIEEKSYLDTPSETELITAAAESMVESIGDRYAAFYTDDEYQSYRESLTGEFVGIGVTITQNDLGAEIVKVNEDGGASEAGLLVGDIVTSVEGTSVAGWSLSEISAVVTGEEDTSVSLGILRDGTEFTVSVPRKKVKTPFATSEMLENNIGYLRLEHFTGDADVEFTAELNKLKEAGMQALVLDLRDNPGGNLEIVVSIADKLLGEGEIVTIKYADGSEEVYRSDASALGLPLAVLVNGNSASASELLSGAVKDLGAGVIVGTTTYGKGVVQTTYHLKKSNTWLKLTTAAYYTPNGTNIDGAGITPDLEVELPEEWQNTATSLIPHESDTQLAAAVEALEKQLQSE